MIQNGIQQILFVTGRNKPSIENHFDDDPALFGALSESKRKDLLAELNFKRLDAHFFYTRQGMQFHKALERLLARA